jgi:hypothetical protein
MSLVKQISYVKQLREPLFSFAVGQLTKASLFKLPPSNWKLLEEEFSLLELLLRFLAEA